MKTKYLSLVISLFFALIFSVSAQAGQRCIWLHLAIYYSDSSLWAMLEKGNNFKDPDDRVELVQVNGRPSYFKLISRFTSAENTIPTSSSYSGCFPKDWIKNGENRFNISLKWPPDGIKIVGSGSVSFSLDGKLSLSVNLI